MTNNDLDHGDMIEVEPQEVGAASSTVHSAVRLPRFVRRSHAGPTALSSSQRMSVDTNDAPAVEHWVPILWRMDGVLNVDAFCRSWLSMLERHEILRTAYHHDGVSWRQEALPSDSSALELIDLAQLPEIAAEKAFHAALRAILASPPPLEAGVTKVALYRMANDVHVLGGFIHHIALDAHSLGLMQREVGASYLAEIGGDDAPPAPKEPPAQFADFAAWENSWLTEDQRERSLELWSRHLAEAKPLYLPWSRNPGDKSSTPKMAAFELPPPVYNSVVRAAREHGVTMNMLFLTVVSLILGRAAGIQQSTLATHIPGRPPGMNDVMGCFSQMRPFHLSFEDDPTFAELLLRARKAFANALDIRQPVSLDFMKQRKIGNVVVNFQSNAPVSDARLEAIRKLTTADQVNASLTSPAPSKAPDTAMAAVDRREPSSAGKISAYTPQLSQPLINEFYRDLHISAVQADRKLAARITYGGERLTQQQARQLTDELVLMHAVASSAPHQRVSELLDVIGRDG